MSNSNENRCSVETRAAGHKQRYLTLAGINTDERARCVEKSNKTFNITAVYKKASGHLGTYLVGPEQYAV